MAFDLASISAGTRLRAPRIILLGVEKIGKSTFAAGSESPIFLPIKGEEGIDSINVSQFPVCYTLEDVHAALYSLYSEKHEYGTVVIDSASAMEPIIHGGICAAAGEKTINNGKLAYGAGVELAGIAWKSLTERIDSLRADRNMASIIIGHVKVKRFDDPAGSSYDQYQFDIHDKTANLLYRWADVILFCNTKVVVKEEKLGFHKDNVRKRGIDVTGGERFLYTQKRPSHPGGGRGVFGQLPYELPLNWGSYMDAVSAATPA